MNAVGKYAARLVLVAVAMLLLTLAWRANRASRSIQAKSHSEPSAHARFVEQRTTKEGRTSSASTSTLRLQGMLGRLGAFAKRIDSGELTFSASRRTDHQPDELMWEIRKLAHSGEVSLDVIENFIRSEKTSLGAKLLLIFALAHPQSLDLAERYASILRSPPHLSCALAICVACDASCTNGIGRGWNEMFRFLVHLGLPSGYDTNGVDLIYTPSDHREFASINSSKYPRDSRESLLEGVVGLLNHEGLGDFHAKILRLARDTVESTDISPELRNRYLESVRSAYRSAGEGWREALTTLLRNRDSEGRADTEFLISNVEKLDIRRKTTVISEIATIQPDALRNEKLAGCLGSVVEHLGRAPSEGGPPYTQHTGLMLALAVEAPGASVLFGRSEFTSVHLRRRMAEALSVQTATGSLSGPVARRVSEINLILLSDSNRRIQWLAAHTLGNTLKQSGHVMDNDIKATIANAVGEWARAESRSQLSSEEREMLQGILPK